MKFCYSLYHKIAKLDGVLVFQLTARQYYLIRTSCPVAAVVFTHLHTFVTGTTVNVCNGESVSSAVSPLRQFETWFIDICKGKCTRSHHVLKLYRLPWQWYYPRPPNARARSSSPPPFRGGNSACRHGFHYFVGLSIRRETLGVG